MHKILHNLGVSELAHETRSGKLSAVDSVGYFLDRVGRGNDTVNAIVTPAPDPLGEARRADEHAAKTGERGPLFGVPFTVKDTIAVAGLPTTSGSAALVGNSTSWTATAVTRLQEAGAILIGKTNCSEFAVDIHAGNPLFGDTRNPWDTNRTPGGSIGGDSAAVAAGFAPFAIGTDFGGSIRWPAHCTGVVGMRPTLGLIPGTGTMPFVLGAGPQPPSSMSVMHRFMTIGPITKSADDLPLLLAVMAGPDGLDSGTVPVVLRDPSEIDLASLAVAWCDGEGTVPVRRDVAAAIGHAAASLDGVVRSVTEARPDGLECAAKLFADLRDGEGLPEVAALVEGRRGLLGDGINRYLERTSHPLPQNQMLELAAQRDAAYARVLRFFDTQQVLLLPVASCTAPAIGVAECDIDGQSVPWPAIGSCCRAISILGLPSAVVPCGRGDDGMPVGVQIIGRPFSDAQIMAVAAAVEHALGRMMPTHDCPIGAAHDNETIG